VIYENYGQLIESVHSLKTKSRIVVVAAEESHIVEAVFKAQEEQVVDPILVGNKQKILDIIQELGLNQSGCEIVDCSESMNPSQLAIDIINAGDGDFLMKGRLETKDLLKAVVDKKNKINTGRVMTHFTLSRVPGYGKLLSMTDGVMQIYPDLSAKKDMIINVVENLIKIGYYRPKVAVICPIEKINPKMSETVDADMLVQMNHRGEIQNCEVFGPISYDLAISRESAEIKGFDCPWSGDFDVLVLPNLISANVLGKSWVYNAGGCNAGMIAGAKVPIALTSRSASAEEKFMCIALCALCAGTD